MKSTAAGWIVMNRCPPMSFIGFSSAGAALLSWRVWRFYSARFSSACVGVSVRRAPPRCASACLHETRHQSAQLPSLTHFIFLSKIKWYLFNLVRINVPHQVSKWLKRLWYHFAVRGIFFELLDRFEDSVPRLHYYLFIFNFFCCQMQGFMLKITSDILVVQKNPLLNSYTLPGRLPAAQPASISSVRKAKVGIIFKLLNINFVVEIFW